MAPTAHTTQEPSEPDLNNGAGITLGVRFTVSAEFEIGAVAVYAPATNSGTYTAGLYRTDTDDDPAGSGTGTLLASGTASSAVIEAGEWNDIDLDEPVTCSPGVVYTAAVHTSSGRFVRTSGAFSSAGLAGGVVTLLQAGSDPNPPGLGSLINGVFTEGAALAYPASAFGLADYFIDVAELDDEPEPPPANVPASSTSIVAALASSGHTVAVLTRSTSTVAAIATSTSTVAEG